MFLGYPMGGFVVMGSDIARRVAIRCAETLNDNYDIFSPCSNAFSARLLKGSIEQKSDPKNKGANPWFRIHAPSSSS
jgi:hypothetical protein